jgi:hypothetical protein
MAQETYRIEMIFFFGVWMENIIRSSSPYYKPRKPWKEKALPVDGIRCPYCGKEFIAPKFLQRHLEEGKCSALKPK